MIYYNFEIKRTDRERKKNFRTDSFRLADKRAPVKKKYPSNKIYKKTIYFDRVTKYNTY